MWYVHLLDIFTAVPNGSRPVCKPMRMYCSETPSRSAASFTFTRFAGRRAVFPLVWPPGVFLYLLSIRIVFMRGYVGIFGVRINPRPVTEPVHEQRAVSSGTELHFHRAPTATVEAFRPDCFHRGHSFISSRITSSTGMWNTLASSWHISRSMLTLRLPFSM